MLPDSNNENKKENAKENSICRFEKHENEKSGTESRVSMKINRYSLNRRSSSGKMPFLVDREFFTNEIPHLDEGTDPSSSKENQDLVHVIQIFHGPSKKKQIEVEEVFERNIMNIPEKKQSQTKNFKTEKKWTKNKFGSSCEALGKYIQEKHGDNNAKTFKYRANTHIPRRKSIDVRNTHRKATQNIYHLPTITLTEPSSILQRTRKTADKVRPYMLNAKSRREIRDYDQFLKKRKCFTRYRKDSRSGKVTAKSNGTSFEVKYISSGFRGNSELSLQETHRDDSNETLAHSKVVDKFRTEPINEAISSCKLDEPEIIRDKTDIVGKKDILDDKTREVYQFFEEYPKLMSSNRNSSMSSSIFDKLKGDERDLPGIYSRFVRRSKGVSSRNSDTTSQSFCSTRNVCNSEHKYCNTDEEYEDSVLNEIIKEKISNRLLELINKAPFKCCNEPVKNIRNDNLCTSETIIQNISPISPKKRKKVDTQKAIDVKSLSNEEKFDKHNSEFKTPHNKEEGKMKKKRSRKISRDDKNAVNSTENSIEKDNRLKQISVTLAHDPIKENLNMSPMTAITMMVLAADKVLAEKTEFFTKK